MRPLQRAITLTPWFLLPLVACQPTATPAGLSDADRAAIQKVLDDMTASLNTPGADLDAAARACYSSDAVALWPNMPVVEGEAAIAAALKSFPPVSNFKLSIVEAEGTGTMAWVRGTYSWTITPPGATSMNDTGKFIEILEKQSDGGWKVAREIYNSDLPAMPAPAPSGD